jgi:hypothetical protein
MGTRQHSEHLKLFVALPEFDADIEDLGVLLPRPVNVAEVAEAIGRMLSNNAIGRGRWQSRGASLTSPR